LLATIGIGHLSHVAAYTVSAAAMSGAAAATVSAVVFFAAISFPALDLETVCHGQRVISVLHEAVVTAVSIRPEQNNGKVLAESSKNYF
jgi:hypothetical protein